MIAWLCLHVSELQENLLLCVVALHCGYFSNPVWGYSKMGIQLYWEQWMVTTVFLAIRFPDGMNHWYPKMVYELTSLIQNRGQSYWWALLILHHFQVWEAASYSYMCLQRVLLDACWARTGVLTVLLSHLKLGFMDWASLDPVTFNQSRTEWYGSNRLVQLAWEGTSLVLYILVPVDLVFDYDVVSPGGHNGVVETLHFVDDLWMIVIRGHWIDGNTDRNCQRRFKHKSRSKSIKALVLLP